MIAVGILIDDPADAEGVTLLADITGRVDDLLEDDPDDVDGVILRDLQLSGPHFPETEDVKTPTLFGWNNEFEGILP